MLKLKLQYFGHLMQRAESLEKTLMLGKIEDKRRRGWQRMRWLDSITDSMDMTLSGEKRNLACCEPQSCKELGSTSVHFSSVAQSCPTLCDPMNRSTPDLPVHHQLPEFTQTHVHRVSDAIQPFHPLSSSSPPAPNRLNLATEKQQLHTCKQRKDRTIG